jgi:hypothetical protein
LENLEQEMSVSLQTLPGTLTEVVVDVLYQAWQKTTALWGSELHATD